jgi:hypothetical protein
MLLSILMASVMYFRSSIHEEDILEHINVKCICVHFSQLVGHCVT